MLFVSHSSASCTVLQAVRVDPSNTTALQAIQAKLYTNMKAVIGRTPFEETQRLYWNYIGVWLGQSAAALDEFYA